MAQMLLSIELRPLSTTAGGKAMEGIILSGLMPVLRNRIQGRACTAVGMSSSSTMSLCFREGWLHLHAKPDEPGLWWTESASVVPPDSPSWEHHLKGATAESVVQQGTDRVLEILFAEKTPYDRGGARLIFEGTGRNANIILVRTVDGRILASLRKVLSSVNRYRTVSPGVVYRKPPSSGYPVSQWSSQEVQAQLAGTVSKAMLCRLLEGVGPRTAGAIIDDSPDVAATVRRLAGMIQAGTAAEWTSGGAGPSKDPLAPPEPSDPGAAGQEYRPSARELGSLLKKRMARERKKADSARVSLGRLRSPDELRMFGNLILTWKKQLRKGMKKAVLEDWNGNRIEFELKASLNPAENAERYFRKAGRIHLEGDRLRKAVQNALKRVQELEAQMAAVAAMTDDEASALLQRLKKPKAPGAAGPHEYVLEGGWRCLAGRNATQNDHLTFRTAGRDDIWLHARGVPGAHVVIRRDGRPDNPGRAVIEQAAQIAARHSSTSGVVPVDWTLVRYVRRMKGGGPGQVVYTREKTVFAQV
jgi:predicted ribosome quality control (RQC) complex YloA/Tae2 family protein